MKLKRLTIRKLLESSMRKEKLINEALIIESVILLIESLSAVDYKKLADMASLRDAKKFKELYKTLAMTYHPDRAAATMGDEAATAAMSQLNAAQSYFAKSAKRGFDGNSAKGVRRGVTGAMKKAGYGVVQDAGEAAASSTARAAASNVERGRSTVKVVEKLLKDPKYYKQISEELADTTLTKALTSTSGRVIPKGAVIDAILPNGVMVFKAGIPAGFSGGQVSSSTVQQFLTTPGPVRDAFSKAITARNAASSQVAKTAAAETGEELAKTGAAAAESGLAKTGAAASGKTAIQTATGTTKLVAKDFAEGAIEKGAQIAKGAPQVETALTQQFVKAGGGKITEEVAEQGAHGLMGSLTAEEVAEVVAKNAGQETAEVAVSASGKFVTGLAKALGPTIVLAFGFYELYNAFTNDEYNDEQFYNALALAAGNMTVGFGTLAMATPAIAVGGGLTVTLAVAFGSTIAASAAGAAGYFLGKTFNDYMSVDTNDLFVSVGRQAADRVGVLDTGMFTKWHEEDEWAEEFTEAAAKKPFKGLNPKDIDEKRRGALFNILAIERTMMLAGEKLMNATGENATIAKKLRSLFDKGFLNAETWYPEFKKIRKSVKIEVKPAKGGEKQGGGKEDQAVKKTKKKGGGAALKWDSYIEKTGSIGNKVKSGFEELAKAEKVNDGNYSTWLKFYNSMRKDKPTMDAIGAKVGSHLSPSQIIKIYEFVMGRSENIKEALMLNNIIWESNLKRKIIKTQKLINLID